MDFGEFRLRLLADLRQRLYCGEWTERALARHVGISQPHMHNVLSGARVLTPEKADSILRQLGLDLLSLAERSELESAIEKGGAGDQVWLVVPVAGGYLGPSHVIPALDVPQEILRLESAGMPPLREPVLVALGDDPGLPWPGGDGSMALLERSRQQRERIVNDAWYAVRWRDHALVRKVRREGTRLQLLTQMDLFDVLPAEVSLEARSLPEMVLGRVVWAGRDPRARRHLPQSGLLPARAAS